MNSQNPRGCARALAPPPAQPRAFGLCPHPPAAGGGGVRGVQETWILAFWEPEAVLDAQGAVGTRTPRTGKAGLRTQRLSEPRVYGHVCTTSKASFGEAALP